jgi:hypothetical protein
MWVVPMWDLIWVVKKSALQLNFAPIFFCATNSLQASLDGINMALIYIVFVVGTWESFYQKTWP